MLRTKFCDLFGIELPIMAAGMGTIALADLAAAVSEAGGMGTVALAVLTPEAMHNELAAARKLTRRPLACNVLLPFLRSEVIEAVAAAPVEAVTLFWGKPSEHIPLFKSTGKKVIWQCGSAEEALAARRAGADAIIAQGVEAGGHVRGVVTSLALIPQVRDAIGPDVPLVAAGGFADGRGLAAALALGADGAVFGTRFLASVEAAAHPAYKQRILTARAEDTVHTTLFDIGWPDAPHRVLRTAAYEEWERAGRPPSGQRPGEGTPIGEVKHAGMELPPPVKYTVMPPTEYVEGDLEQFAFYAGMSCALTNEILPAGDIVRRIAAEAREVIAKRLAPLG
ncbi:MAG TPA: nitronate monooxygenase [Candidatus Binataceae bacterium]|nr:nitronate monooxygenase [Candidatus Binataceae bacterium]